VTIQCRFLENNVPIVGAGILSGNPFAKINIWNIFPRKPDFFPPYILLVQGVEHLAVVSTSGELTAATIDPEKDAKIITWRRLTNFVSDKIREVISVNRIYRDRDSRSRKLVASEK
jgi:hypothetical protein